MAIGITGLHLSGKTTVFNAVTRGKAKSANGGARASRPQVAISKLSDVRLDRLASMSSSRHVAYGEVEFVDIPGAPKGLGKTHGIGGAFLNLLQRCDSLVLVVRAFEDPRVAHPLVTVDPYRDAAIIEAEMAFSDLILLERREERIRLGLKGAKAVERGTLQRELELIGQLRGGLETEVPVRAQGLAPETRRLVGNFGLLTAKPVLLLANVGDQAVGHLREWDQELHERFGRPGVAAAALSGKLEMELTEMDVTEEAQFRASLGAGESGLGKVVRLCYGLMGLISFFTTGENETKAWSVAFGTTALEAAGKVHSDIQRGFIRAEVVDYEALSDAGSIVEARRCGALRTEGKQYIVRDGDVVHFLFNV